MDLSSGLSLNKESVVTSVPDIPFWTENMLFAGYDIASDVGFWLHLGTVPNDWTMWEDRVLVCLPGDEGVLSMWAYSRPDPERRPGGANLVFKCIEPFRHWRVSFDGFAQHIPNAAMATGLAPDSIRKRLVIELDVRSVSPVWDAQTAAKSQHGKGDMDSQGWAKEHYEQMWRATGVIRVDNKDIPFDGAGWRDHSRGPRGGETADPWGGHVIAGVMTESGRSAIFSRYWRPDGVINLEGAQLADANGNARFVEVIEAPRLTELKMKGETLVTVLGTESGKTTIAMHTTRSIWVSMLKHLAVGKDLEGPGLMYVLNFGACEMDGEKGIFYIERSDQLNAAPATLRSNEI